MKKVSKIALRAREKFYTASMPLFKLAGAGVGFLAAAKTCLPVRETVNALIPAISTSGGDIAMIASSAALVIGGAKLGALVNTIGHDHCFRKLWEQETAEERKAHEERMREMV